jgi:Flp pilus assembly protein TadD
LKVNRIVGRARHICPAPQKSVIGWKTISGKPFDATRKENREGGEVKKMANEPTRSRTKPKKPVVEVWKIAVADANHAVGEGRMDDALQLMEKCAGQYPDQAEVQALLATLLSVRQKYGEAAEVLRHAIAASPQEARLQTMLETLLTLQAKPAADNTVRPELGPEKEFISDQLREVALTLSMKIKRSVGAEEVRRAANLIRQSLESPDIMNAFLQADPPAGDVELALLEINAAQSETDGRADLAAAYRQIVALLTSMAPPRAGWKAKVAEADRAAGEGRLSDALALLEECATRFPDEPEVHALLATVLSFRKRYSEATEVLRRAIIHSPDNARLFVMLGTLMTLQGNLSAAASAYARAVQIDPANAEAKTNLALVEQTISAVKTAGTKPLL